MPVAMETVVYMAAARCLTVSWTVSGTCHWMDVVTRWSGPDVKSPQRMSLMGARDETPLFVHSWRVTTHCVRQHHDNKSNKQRIDGYMNCKNTGT